MLPAGISCPRETRDLLVECCVGTRLILDLSTVFNFVIVEFIHLMASESNEICEKSNKKTISPEHVIEALRTLGFDAYIEEVEAEFREHQVSSKSKDRVKTSKLEASGLSEAELLRQQEELFERARQRMNSTTSPLKTEATADGDPVNDDSPNDDEDVEMQ